jgi:hypothetical protein
MLQWRGRSGCPEALQLCSSTPMVQCCLRHPDLEYLYQYHHSLDRFHLQGYPLLQDKSKGQNHHNHRSQPNYRRLDHYHHFARTAQRGYVSSAQNHNQSHMSQTLAYANQTFRTLRSQHRPCSPQAWPLCSSTPPKPNHRHCRYTALCGSMSSEQSHNQSDRHPTLPLLPSCM